ncbi:amino acid adenylation domain-containing protein [Oleiagrimonas sp. MCCC 1A03011]|uniref:amino acid adenylation domain-containing protein n=1 Tax=Oleiagrimonas sp. MCCC 1A03011 TaxID=1926883 RepID=UPI000DC458F3|nr:amino acid adenylation domain-containing protein [Oleiagrimonas sp. MCCC 1A03011]RAP55676.1 hypothetical protein BTJ49_14985 [Oleiagrimonas sp. MCCC 1A03011]
MCIHHRVDYIVDRFPKKVAVKWRDGCLTYEELNARANSLAHDLIAAGVIHSDVVALSMRQSADLIISMLAVLKAGAAYLPLEESISSSRKRKYMEDARVTHIISNRSAEPWSFDRKVICINALNAYPHVVSDKSMLSVSSRPEDKAYVMFTSGSTGEAKGVVVPHRAVMRLVVDTNYIQLSADDNILQLSSPAFDASTFEIWGAILNGATLVFSSEIVFDPNALKRDSTKNGITILWLTAALFHIIGDRYIDSIRSVKTLLAGGDVLSPRIINKVLDALPNIRIINGYGPTENTTFTCCHNITTKNRPSFEGVPIGKAVSGTEIFILDETLAPVAEGEVGELFVAGKGVALGYLNGDVTESFFHDEKICDGLIYRTGDLVRENINHELEFIGRRDNLVKVRGFRVSLDGVRQAILQLKEVVDALVSLHKEEAGDELLIAHINLRQGASSDLGEIKERLRMVLPDYSIPDRFVFDELLSVTVNGKLDRKRTVS